MLLTILFLGVVIIAPFQVHAQSAVPVDTPSTVKTVQPKTTTTPSAAPVEKVVVPLNSAAPVLPMNITISPISLNLNVKPGEVRQAEIKVLNNGSQPEEIYLELKTFKAQGKKGQAALLDVTGNEEFLKWLTFDQSTYIVQPGEWKSITATFAPPANADLSYYYSILFQRRYRIKSDQTTLEAVPAMLTLTTVDTPNARRELELTDFQATPKIAEFLPETFTVSVRNNGNVHSAPTGNIFIHGQGKKDLSVLSFNPEGGQILPNSDREFTVKWRDGFPSFKDADEGADVSTTTQGSQFLGLSWNFGKAHMFRFGKYTANLIMVYDDGQRDVPVEAQVSFWVIPWRILISAGLIGLFVVFGVATLVRSVINVVPRSSRKPRKR